MNSQIYAIRKAIRPLLQIRLHIRIADCSIRVSQSFSGIVQSADFLAAKASLSPQNASIIPDSIMLKIMLA